MGMPLALPVRSFLRRMGEFENRDEVLMAKMLGREVCRIAAPMLLPRQSFSLTSNKMSEGNNGENFRNNPYPTDAGFMLTTEH
jgi:hypothetical protein